MSVPERKKTLQIRPPSEATHWILFRTRNEKGKSGHHGRQERLTGPTPDSDGKVADMWPVSEFSTMQVLNIWGPGRYRAEWYTGAGEHMRGLGSSFMVANPPDANEPRLAHVRRRRRTESAIEAGEFEGVPVRSEGSMGMLDVMTLRRAEREAAERRAELAAERARQESLDQRQRDREFMQQMMALVGQQQRTPGPAADVNAIARELNLSMREQMFALRQELGLQQLESARQEAEAGAAGGGSIEDAVEGIGHALLDELEEQVPQVVREGLPDILNFFRSKGYQPSAEMEARLSALRTLANGAGGGHANGS